MTMRQAEQEVLRLCPDSYVSLSYERQHPMPDQIRVECRIWVSGMYEHFKGSNWDTAVMQLRDRLLLNMPQSCPDEEEVKEVA